MGSPRCKFRCKIPAVRGRMISAKMSGAFPLMMLLVYKKVKIFPVTFCVGFSRKVPPIWVFLHEANHDLLPLIQPAHHWVRLFAAHSAHALLAPSPLLKVSPSSEQRLITAEKVWMEKSTLQSMYLRSGSWMRSVLCIGVKWMTASAVMLYWSSVQRVLSSQTFFSGHHMAWSDQSMAMSGGRRKFEISLQHLRERLNCRRREKKKVFPHPGEKVTPAKDGVISGRQE